MANVANVKAPLSTNVVLIMVLMAIAIICLGVLSLDYRHKINLLHEDVKRLESTQVLLMVPDEHAEVIATWLATHPDQTQAMLKLASPGEQKAVTLGFDTSQSADVAQKEQGNIPPLLDNAPVTEKSPNTDVVQTPFMSEPSPLNLALPSKSDEQPNTKVSVEVVPVVVSENADGVKVISLPNGGIRVTTREGD